MNSVSPVSTPHGSSSACSQTTIEIDSGVWPGRVADLEDDLAEREPLAVRQRLDREVGLAPSP